MDHTEPVTGDHAQPQAPAPATPALASYVRPHLPLIVLGAVLSLATTATGLALPLVVRELITALSEHQSISGLLVLMTLLVLGNAAIGALGSHVLARTAESVVLQARRRLVAHLVRLRVSALDHTEPGDLISRVTSDTTRLSDVVTGTLINGLTGLLATVATLVMMVLLDPILAAVTVGSLATATAVISTIVPRILRLSRHAQDQMGLMGAALERMFGAFRTVKASTAEARERARVDAAAEQVRRAEVRASIWQALAGNTSGLSLQVAFIIVLSIGGHRVANGSINVGTLVALLFYIYYLMSPLQAVAGAVTDYQHGRAAIRRLQEAEALPAEPPGSASSSTTTASAHRSRTAAGVRFESVTFRYTAGLPAVLDDVSFDLPPVGLTALVGPSGAGKTTVLSLIERFYEPTHGRVLLDGRDLPDWPLGDLRARIGYVEQDAPVLSGTLRENLVYGAPHVTDEELAAVLRTTRLHDFVAALPDGLHTQVGHRGVKLSGGERQRVAIARALLRRPGLLLLDEATSQLDALNEAALRDTVAEIARTTTVIVVAHRLSTITLADRILVLDRGRLVAAGTHEQLLRTDGLYAELAATQFITSSTTPSQVTSG